MATKKTATQQANEAKNAAKKARAEAAKAKTQAVKARAAQIGGGQAAGFINFIRERGIIGLAVGLAVGTAAGASVKVIVDNLINPLVALLTQGVDLSSLKWVIEGANAKHGEVAIGWGAIVSSLITLIATVFVVYLAIHAARLDRLDRKSQ